VFRFANRIPLLFEPGSDVVTKQAADVDWGRYKIDKASARVGIFVSVRARCQRWLSSPAPRLLMPSTDVVMCAQVVSTRIPFRGTGKEHIAEDVKELAEEARALFQ
jgi:DNA topoisomerase-6 subunit B